MWLSSRLCGHVEQYSLFQLLCDSSYDIYLGFLAHGRSWEVDSSRWESSRHPYDFHIALVSNVKGTVETGRQCLNESAMVTDHKLTKVPVVLVEG